MEINPPKLTRPSRPSLVTFAIAVVVGFLLSAQFFSTKKVAEITDPDQQKNLALEVSILAESNDTLRAEVESLEQKAWDYDEALKYRLPGTEVLRASLVQYQEVSGLQELNGTGVSVVLDGPVLDVQLLDLLNTLRNIGMKGVALNGNRIVYDSVILPAGLQIALDNVVLVPPYRFDVVGDADLLAESLQRTGGILEQISQMFPEIKVSVTKKDSLTLPAYRDTMEFHYARTTE
jgi:uncharacterized protein YlxW (UPF0749 family)